MQHQYYYKYWLLSHVVCNTVGKDTKLPGQPCGAGLTTEAADALGLNAGLPVAVSSIDAHAGALGNNDSICSSLLFCFRADFWHSHHLLTDHVASVYSYPLFFLLWLISCSRWSCLKLLLERLGGSIDSQNQLYDYDLIWPNVMWSSSHPHWWLYPSSWSFPFFSITTLDNEHKKVRWGIHHKAGFNQMVTDLVAAFCHQVRPITFISCILLDWCLPSAIIIKNKLTTVYNKLFRYRTNHVQMTTLVCCWW